MQSKKTTPTTTTAAGAGDAAEKMTDKEIAERLGISRSMWKAGVERDDYPEPIRVGRRAIRWSRDVVERIARDGMTPGAFAEVNAKRREHAALHDAANKREKEKHAREKEERTKARGKRAKERAKAAKKVAKEVRRA